MTNVRYLSINTFHVVSPNSLLRDNNIQAKLTVLLPSKNLLISFPLCSKIKILNQRLGESFMYMLYYGDELGDMKRQNPGNPHLETLDDLYWILRECWSKETAYPSCQADWMPNDPSYGQCAITAMLVHDLFGGTIHRIRVIGGGTHYFNCINGHYVDLTREQFDLYDIPVSYEPNEAMSRVYCGKNPDTKKRYSLLVNNIYQHLKSLD